jgi:hypothetical protein
LRALSFRCLVAAVVATAGTVVVTPGSAWAYDPTGHPETSNPYAQPSDANVPKRGCATIAANPAAPSPSSPMAVQVIYAWTAGNGDHYTSLAQFVAKKADRVDWMLDESTNYDQHFNFSCKYTPNSTYADYAQALVAKFQVTSFNPGGETDTNQIRNDLIAAGYNDPNRTYLVFADLDTGADALFSIAILDEWTGSLAFHELLHNFALGHAWSKEDGGPYFADIMGDTGFWATDQDFNTYYDPKEPAATFWAGPYPQTPKLNLADDAGLTTPTCCDVGFSNELLTAQERTIEATAPWGTPTGFSVSGGGWFQVTPPGSDSLVSARFYDGRRSLTMNVQSHADGFVSVTRRPSVTAGSTYRFFARITTNTSGNVKMRISWYNASNSLISNSDSGTIGLTSGWEEYDLTATAPSGAARAQLTVVSPSGQNFAYILDTLNFNLCNNPNLAGGCRTSV